jgi:hypothetical protein
MEERTRSGRDAGVLIPLDAEEALRALREFRRSEPAPDRDARRIRAEQPRES